MSLVTAVHLGQLSLEKIKIKAEIVKGAPYAIPMTLVNGVVDALNELGVKKLVVGTPYLDEIDTAEAEFLIEKGFEVLDIHGLNLETALGACRT
jgi:maleate isomerase